MIELNIVKKIEGETAIVYLEGDLDQPNAKAFLDNMLSMVEDNRVTRIIIELNNLSFLDSLGLGALVRLQKKIQADGGAMALVCWKDAVLKVFELSGLWQSGRSSNRVALFDSISAAQAI